MCDYSVVMCSQLKCQLLIFSNANAYVHMQNKTFKLFVSFKYIRIYQNWTCYIFDIQALLHLTFCALNLSHCYWYSCLILQLNTYLLLLKISRVRLRSLTSSRRATVWMTYQKRKIHWIMLTRLKMKQMTRLTTKNNNLVVVMMMMMSWKGSKRSTRVRSRRKWGGEWSKVVQVCLCKWETFWGLFLLFSIDNWCFC